MKAITLTETSQDIGFGHLSRCIALSQAFEEKNVDLKIIVNAVNGYRNTKFILKGRNYQMFNWLKEQNKLFSEIAKIDLVIIDSYLAPKSLYDKISEITNGKLLMIDDYKRIEYPRGIVVNSSIYGDKINYPKKEGVSYLLGRKYIILRKEFWKIPSKKINKKIKNILITFGGKRYSGSVQKITNALNNKSGFNFLGGKSYYQQFKGKKWLNLMLKADLCISGGGVTINELARIGVPTIGVCFAENQKLNLKEWQEIGFIEHSGNYHDKSLMGKIKTAINKLSPCQEREKRSKIGRKHVDGRGAVRMANELIKRRFRS